MKEAWLRSTCRVGFLFAAAHFCILSKLWAAASSAKLTVVHTKLLKKNNASFYFFFSFSLVTCVYCLIPFFYIYIFFFILFSILVYHRMSNIVPYAVQ